MTSEGFQVVTPGSFFNSRHIDIRFASNGVIVRLLLPGRMLSDDGQRLSPLPFRGWVDGEFVYNDWPSARNAINAYVIASPEELVAMARVAFFEREADAEGGKGIVP